MAQVQFTLENDISTLQEFYADSNKGQEKYKDLFHKFKKVEIEGGFEAPPSEDDILKQFESPKLVALLKAKASYADYSCSFKAGVLKSFDYNSKDPKEHTLKQWTKKRKKHRGSRVACPKFAQGNGALREWVNTHRSRKHNRIVNRRRARATRVNNRRRNRYNNKKEKYGSGESFETLQLIGIEDPGKDLKKRKKTRKITAEF